MFSEIELTPKPSYFLISLIGILHLLALFSINMAEISVMTKIMSVLFILVSAYYSLITLLGLYNTSIISCSYRKKCWTIKDRSGKEYEAILLNSGLISRYGIILNFKFLHHCTEQKIHLLTTQNFCKKINFKYFEIPIPRLNFLINSDSYRTLILCPDSISTDDFRKLSAILLLERQT